MANLKRRAQVAAAAMRSGHDFEVVHLGKRFTLKCACGFTTPANWTRKHAFGAAQDHFFRAGRTALGEDPLLGRIPAKGEPGYDGVSLPDPKIVGL